MQLHAPHFNPRQRALLRSLLGAIVAILFAAALIGLMAFLLVFPNDAFGLKVVPLSTHAEPLAASVIQAAPARSVPLPSANGHPCCSANPPL